jgi:hypothetical protein
MMRLNAKCQGAHPIRFDTPKPKQAMHTAVARARPYPALMMLPRRRLPRATIICSENTMNRYRTTLPGTIKARTIRLSRNVGSTRKMRAKPMARTMEITTPMPKISISA